MTRSSQTHLAVLGALSVEPMTGYAVRAAITTTLGHFWSESFGQIYPALTELTARGEIRPSQPGRTSGSRFEVTATGLARLRELLAEPPASAPPRNGLLLRIFFGEHLGAAPCQALVQASADQVRSMLAGYAAIRTEIEAEIAAARSAGDTAAAASAAYRLLTLSAGEYAAHAHLAWAADALATLATLATHPDGPEIP
jgi:DNA-binding PadR family transcriptional regulator